jgi:kynurenine formamidase
MSHQEPDTQQIIEWMSELSNWGRWGSQDVLGTRNYITEEVRRRAVAEVSLGITISCAWEIEATAWPDGMANRYMHASGEGASSVDGAAHRVHVAADVLEVAVHGLQGTHLDGLSHWFWDGQMYNARPAQLVTVTDGATEFGMETVPDGIVTRGVLLDVAASRGVKELGPGEAVQPEDLEHAEELQNVRVEAGDAVLLYAGYSVPRGRTAEAYAHDSTPGWGSACLPWLHERQVAVIGGEFSNEVKPNKHAVFNDSPIHTVGIVAMGLWLIDGCNLRRLANVCAAESRWTFLFVVASLPVQGSTGSLVNPIAIL